jgi:hypothetical protein
MEFHEDQLSVSQVRLGYRNKHRNTQIQHGNFVSLLSSFPATTVGQTQPNGSYIMSNICGLTDRFIPKIIVGKFTGVAVNLTRFSHWPIGQKRDEEFHFCAFWNVFRLSLMISVGRQRPLKTRCVSYFNGTSNTKERSNCTPTQCAFPCNYASTHTQFCRFVAVLFFVVTGAVGTAALLRYRLVSSSIL